MVLINNKRGLHSKAAKRVATVGDVKRIIRGQAEIKRYVAVSVTNGNTTAGSITNLSNGIVQGDDLTQRAGDQIRMVKHILSVRATAITVSQTFRFIWIKDNTNRGTVPTVLEVLSNVNFMAPYAPAPLQQSRFSILADFKLNCSLTGESIKSRTLKLPGKLVSYNGATAVAASNGPGATFLLVIGDSNTGLWDFSYEAHYTDL